MSYEHAKVVILTAGTNLVDVTGTATGVIGGPIVPSWPGQRGWMTHADAATAEGLNHCKRCFHNTPHDIDLAVAAAAPI